MQICTVLLFICFLLISPIITRSQTEHLLISKIHPQKSVEKHIQDLYQPSLNISRIEINQDIILNNVKKGDYLALNLNNGKEYHAKVIKCGKSFTGSHVITAFVEDSYYSKIIITSFNVEIFGIIEIIDEKINLFAINTNPYNKNTYLIQFDPENQNFFNLGDTIPVNDREIPVQPREIKARDKKKDLYKFPQTLNIQQMSNDPSAINKPALLIEYSIDGGLNWAPFNENTGEIINENHEVYLKIEPENISLIPAGDPYYGTENERCLFLSWESSDWLAFNNNVETILDGCYSHSETSKIKFIMPSQDVELTANFLIPPRGIYGWFPEDDDELTIMIIYTSAAENIIRTQYGGSVNNFITLNMENLNWALGPYYDNQIWDPPCLGGTCSKVSLVHYEKVEYTEYDGTETYPGNLKNLQIELNRLTCTGDNHPLNQYSRTPDQNGSYMSRMDGIHEKRDRYNADLVLLFTSSGLDGNIAGIAWPLLNRGIGAGSDLAFAVVDLHNFNDSRILTFIHEIGHLLGAGHHKQANIPGPQLFTNSAGWQFNGYPYLILDTVMASDMAFPGNYRIGHFSNPNLQLHEFDDEAGHIDDGYNARTIEYSQRMAAKYKINDYNKYLTLYISPETAEDYENQVYIDSNQWFHEDFEAFEPDSIICIAVTEKNGFEFVNWHTSYTGDLADPMNDPYSTNTTITMPHQHLILTANFLPPKIFRFIINGIDILDMAAYTEKKAVISLQSWDYTSSGVYIYNHKSQDNKWYKFFDHPATQVIVNPNTEEIIIRINNIPGHEGIYRVNPNKGACEQISDMPSNYIAFARTDHNSEKSIIASFTGVGLYQYDNTTGNWNSIIQYPPEIVVCSNLDDDIDSLDKLLVTFEDINGLYLYDFNTKSFENILQAKPSQIISDDITGNGIDELVCVFNGIGTYIATYSSDKAELILASPYYFHRGFSWERITIAAPDYDHNIATCDFEYGSLKEILMTYNGSTYYYQYDEKEWSTLIHAPFSRITSGKFTEALIDDLILYCPNIESLFIYGEPD